MNRRKPHPTGQDRALLAAIADYQRTHGYAPSIRDLVRARRMSSTSVCQHRLSRLEDLGLIRRSYGIARSIRIVGDPGRWIPTP